MYFEGKITIDPSQVTRIEHVKPSKTLQRILYYLTIGGVTEKLERESFSSSSILNRFNKIFSKHGINNVVRLCHDSIDFYLDERGKKDDFKSAIQLYNSMIDESMTIDYKQIELILEHDQDEFKYLIEVKIIRDHQVGEYPIEIKVTGLLKEFCISKEEINTALKDIFSSQEKFNNFKSDREERFKTILNEIKNSVEQIIEIDDMTSEVKTKVIIPQQKISDASNINYHREEGYKGIYYGYHKFDKYLLYTYLWTSIASEYSIQYKDTYFETDTNKSIGHSESLNFNSDNFNYSSKN